MYEYKPGSYKKRCSCTTGQDSRCPRPRWATRVTDSGRPGAGALDLRLSGSPAAAARPQTPRADPTVGPPVARDRLGDHESRDRDRHVTTGKARRRLPGELGDRVTVTVAAARDRSDRPGPVRRRDWQALRWPPCRVGPGVTPGTSPRARPRLQCDSDRR
jgi:hypothetical protein